MSVIIKKPWTKQPQLPIGIDKSNPLSKGLIVAGHCIATPPINALGNGSITDSLGTQGVGAIGKFSSRNGESTSLISTQTTSVAPSTLVDFTVFLLVQPRATTLAVAVSGAVQASMWLGHDTVWKTSQGNGPAVSTSKVQAVFFRRFGSSLTICVDGVFGTAFTDAQSFSSGAFFTIGNYGPDSFPVTGDLYDFKIWSRGLSNSEIAQITINPWQVFKPQQRVLFAPVAAASGAGSGSGTSVAIGLGTGSSLFTSSATGTVVATGLGTGASLFSSYGTGTGVATGSAVAVVYGAGTSVATGSGVGASLFTGVGTGTEVSTGAGVGASLFSGNGAGTSVATGSAVGLSGGNDGNGTAVFTGLAVGASLFYGAGSGTGVATGSGVSSGVYALGLHYYNGSTWALAGT